MADLSKKIDQNYATVINTIRKHGKPNPTYPKDKDLVYKELRAHLPAIGGLGTVLKNMKNKKLVDYGGHMIVDDTIITLVEDYAQEAHPDIIKYDEINEKIKSQDTSHTRSVSETS